LRVLAAGVLLEIQFEHEEPAANSSLFATFAPALSVCVPLDERSSMKKLAARG
jgi:hypothetical protein